MILAGLPLPRRRFLAGAALLPLAACGGGEPGYYTLTPVASTPRPGAPATVEVRTPSVASYLDRDAIVRSDAGQKLSMASNAAWASPLAEMIGRTLALDLGQRLPGTNVYTQSGAISTEALALVELDVSRFLGDAAGRAEIEATLAVYRPNSGPAPSRSLHFVSNTEAAGIGALVAGLSQVLAQVADVAAVLLRALPPAPVPS